MPRRVYNFDRPDRFICGAVGEPGQRTFFLQATKGAQRRVGRPRESPGSRARRAAGDAAARPAPGRRRGRRGAAAADLALEEPVVEQFRVGLLTLGWDGDRERVVIEARELGDEDIEIDDAEAEDEPVATAAERTALEAVDPVMAFVAAEVDEDLDVVRVQLEPPAALAFASGALAVVQAGRPPCPQCGAPLDPTGHFCPRRNGYTH